MDFLGIGPLEIALVVLIAFIVLGPERIPGAMRQLGTWIRELREMANNITRDYNADIQQLTGEITALQEEIRSIQRDLGQAATGFLTPPPPAKRPHTANPPDVTPSIGAAPGSQPRATEPPPDEQPQQPDQPVDESYSI